MYTLEEMTFTRWINRVIGFCFGFSAAILLCLALGYYVT